VLIQRGVEAPKVVRCVAPVYPNLARRLNLEGPVRLPVIVADDGTAKTTEVLGGNPVVAKSAQDAVPAWKWVLAVHESKQIVALRFRR